MLTWVKPNGVKVTTNDYPETIKTAESLGWVLDKPKKTRAKGK